MTEAKEMEMRSRKNRQRNIQGGEDTEQMHEERKDGGEKALERRQKIFPQEFMQTSSKKVTRSLPWSMQFRCR